MSILIPGTEQGVYQEPETPMTYNQGLGAWEETSGYTFDADAQAWTEAWDSKKILFADGSAAGMGGYTTSNYFQYDTGSWSGANGITTCTVVDGLLKLYAYRDAHVGATGFHIISNDYLQLDKYRKLYVQVDSGYMSYDGHFEIGIKTDEYLYRYEIYNQPNSYIEFVLPNINAPHTLDISGVHCLPIVNKDKSKLVISLYTNAGSYDHQKEMEANISKIWLE